MLHFAHIYIYGERERERERGQSHGSTVTGQPNIIQCFKYTFILPNIYRDRMINLKFFFISL